MKPTDSLFNARRQMVEKFDPDGSRRARVERNHGGLPAMPESCDHCLTVLERDAFAEGVRISYRMTPVDSLLSDLYGEFICGTLTDDYWNSRSAQFRSEVADDA